MATDYLCIGDRIYLFCEDSDGYLYSYESSDVFSGVSVYCRQDPEKPANILNPLGLVFVICSPNRYKLNKQYSKLLSAFEGSSDQHRKLLSDAKLAAEAETEDNHAEWKRRKGKKIIYYGQTIQLKHVLTEKYLCVSTTQTSKRDKNYLKVHLQSQNGRKCQFLIHPQYKVKAEGHMVLVKDQIVLESVRSSGHSLHCSSPYSVDVFPPQRCELNLGAHATGFTVELNYRARTAEQADSLLKGGSVIRLFHKEQEAYLAAEGTFNNRLSENVHFRVRKVDAAKPKTYYPTTNAVTYWQIEHEDNPLKGEVVKWEQQVRLRHMTTRMYLCINSSKHLHLTNTAEDPNTVFRLHPVIIEDDVIVMESYARIEHVLTGHWVHALDEKYERHEYRGDSDTLENIRWDNVQLLQGNVIQEKQYNDAFTIQKVPKKDCNNFNFVAGMVLCIMDLIEDVKRNKVVNLKKVHCYRELFEELSVFMIVDGEPITKRQKLLRNLKIVDLLMELVQFPTAGLPSEKNLKTIFELAFDVLREYLIGNSRKNELYMAKNITFLITLFDSKSELGLRSVEMVTELIRDNRKIIDRIYKAQINHFVQLLKETKNYRYFDLLSILCVCDGICITENQSDITKQWLSLDKDGVFLTELGQVIDRKKDVVYVSTNNGISWIALYDFVDIKKSGTALEDYLFLVGQLGLFGDVCRARNKYAINLITKELGYLTWDEAFICLKEDAMPDELRATYANIIRELFVDVGDVRPSLEHERLVYNYSKLNCSFINQTQNSSSGILSSLKVWVASFLREKKNMITSNIGHNKLIEEVLKLLYHLVDFGYYGNTEDIKTVIEPLLNLIDGRNDLQYTTNDSQQFSCDDWKTERFKHSEQNTAVVNAKYWGMEIVDMLLTLQLNLRMEGFISYFKSHCNKREMKQLSNEVTSLLKDWKAFDNKANKLKKILLDCSCYHYDKMVTKSMALLHKIFSLASGMFSLAVEVQVVITPESIKVFEVVERDISILNHLSNTKLTHDEAEHVCRILDVFTRICHLPNEPEENHPVNQKILMNYDAGPVVFDILCRKNNSISQRPIDMSNVQLASLRFLRHFAMRNPSVQKRIFERMNEFLDVKGEEKELALMLTEVFTDNQELCIKIHPQLIGRILCLAAEHRQSVPEFLDLLCAIVEVEELNLPLRRNQAYVMKYLMQNYDDLCHILDDQQRCEGILLNKEGPGPLSFIISLVDLFAICAEGENMFIESICHNILPIKELMWVLNHDGISNNLKRPYLRFLLWVYMNTGGGIIQSGASVLHHGSDTWTFLSRLCFEANKLTEYAINNESATTHMLKAPPPKSSVPNTKEGIALGSIHFFMGAAFPFIQVFFTKFYQVDKVQYPHETEIVNKLARALLLLCDTLCKCIACKQQMSSIIHCMTAILPASCLEIQLLEDFLEKHSGNIDDQVISDSRKDYKQYYREEIALNKKFNKLSLHCQRLYNGSNTVSSQLGLKSDREYCNEDEMLPLGRDFQEHVYCFESPKSNMAGKLIKQLQISLKCVHIHEVDRRKQEKLDIRCLQLLKAIVHNEERKLPVNWQEKTDGCERQLRALTTAQNFLNKDGVLLKTLHLMSHQNDEIVKEELALLATMLLNANQEVQKSIEDFFVGTREEVFFATVKNRIRLSAISIQERRFLMAQHLMQTRQCDAEMEEIEKMCTMGKAALQKLHSKEKPKDVFSEIISSSGKKKKTDINANDMKDLYERTELNEIKVEFQLPDSIGEQSKQGESSDFEFKVEGSIELILKVISGMCDGQNTVLQDYLRDQPDNITSANLVAETTDYLDNLYHDITDVNIDLVTQILDTLNELASGNAKNKNVIFDNKIIDYINYILRVSNHNDQGENPSIKTALLWKHIAQLLCTMLEETDSNSAETINSEIKEVLDLDAIQAKTEQSFELMERNHGWNRDLWEDIGFLFHCVLCRCRDLVKSGKKGMKVDATHAGKHFTKCTQTIEVMKDDCIQSIYYKVSEKDIVRKEVRQKLKWDVDRSSPSTKIRDLMDWSSDIIDDIRYHQRVMENKITAFFINNWMFWNIALILLSIIINIVMLITWKSKASLGSLAVPKNATNLPKELFNPVPAPIFDGYIYVNYCLGAVHNIVSLCLFISFCLGNKFQFTHVQLMYRWLCFKKNATTSQTLHSSRLAVEFVSFTFLYYLLIVVMSGLGTAFYGFFFVFHLFNIVTINELLKRVIEAVTKNGRSLLWVAVLAVIIMYAYGLLCFAFLRSAFNPANGLYCDTLSECVVTVLHYGVHALFVENMAVHQSQKSFQLFGIMTIFHLTFTIVVTTIILNLVFGIIVDTFSELRDLKWKAETDMREKCFICGCSSYDFEHYGKGFENHVKKDHNMWAYIIFFLHLESKSRNSCNGLELYIKKKLAEGDYGFFPIDRALVLEGIGLSSNETKIDNLMSHVAGLVQKQQAEELSKEKAEEKLKQKMWEDEHRHDERRTIQSPDKVLRNMILDK